MTCTLSIDEFASPLGFLRQALWVRASRSQPSARASERLWIWAETLSGRVVALSLFDVTLSTTDLLSALSAALRATTSDWRVLQAALRDPWLIAPEHHGQFQHMAPLVPAQKLLREATAWAEGACADSPCALPPESMREQLARVTQAFLQRLDPHILRQLERREPLSPRVVDYNRYAQWPQPQRQYRLQAIWSFPWIDALFVSGESGDERLRRDAMPSTIDEARKLLPVMQDAFGVCPAAIRNLRHVAHLIGGSPARARALAWALDARNPRPWNVADEPDIAELLDGLETFDWLGERGLIASLARDLDFAQARRLLRQLVSIGYPLPEGCDDEERTIVALFGTFAAVLGGESRAHGLRELQRIIADEGASGALRCVSMFVDRITQEFRALLESSGSGVSWPAILAEPLTMGHLVATELLSAEALAREGRVMGHCVGEYWMECARGASHIFSVCTVAGDHVSTIEFTFRHGELQCVEHRGRRNAPPSAEALDMERHLRRTIQAAIALASEAGPERDSSGGRWARRRFALGGEHQAQGRVCPDGLPLVQDANRSEAS